GPTFAGMLGDLGAATLVLTGVETDVCVLSTALEAIERGHRVVIATDAVTSSSPTGHRAALDHVLPRFEHLLDLAPSADIIAAWRKRRRMPESRIPGGRGGNGWDGEHPAAMRYLPLGLDIDLCAYAASRNSFTRFPAGAEGLRLGPRDIDGNGITLDLVHAGTRLSLAYDKPDAFTLRGRWQAGRPAR